MFVCALKRIYSGLFGWWCKVVCKHVRIHIVTVVVGAAVVVVVIVLASTSKTLYFTDKVRTFVKARVELSAWRIMRLYFLFRVILPSLLRTFNVLYFFANFFVLFFSSWNDDCCWCCRCVADLSIHVVCVCVFCMCPFCSHNFFSLIISIVIEYI